ncbi:MAG: hypothetical protein AAGG08_18500, partial [Actinomycetota bacterium]
TNPDSDQDDVVVDVEPQYPERDRIVAELVGWLAGDVAPDDVESVLGVSGIPEPFFTVNEQAFAEGRPYTVEQTTMLPDRSETVIEGAAGRHVRLTVEYDGNEVAAVEIMPVGPEAGTELENGIGLIDEQLRWLAGEEFTERDFVRRHSAVGRDSYGSYANFVDIVDEIRASGPYDDVVHRGFTFDGSGIVLLRRADGGLLMYSARTEDGRISGATIQTSDG